MPPAATREQSATCHFARHPAEVARAREAARNALFNWDLGKHADLAELVVSELVTNAIRHGAGPIRVRLSCDATELLIEVHDDGPRRPVRRPVTLKDESGRGLELVDGLLELQEGRRTIIEDRTGAGKTVCAALPLASSA